jgi:two-component system response regulator ChvI
MNEGEAPLIAIVDDEERLCSTLAQAFQREGFHTCTHADGLAAWKAFEQSGLPDLAILDITMPRLDGLELCRRIRGLSERLPVIFLTARDDEFDRVLGLELGADDYLCKPFSLRELIARVRVLFRRAALASQPEARRAADSPRAADDEPVACGALRLDPQRLETAWRGAAVKLTVTEFRILAALAREPGVVRTREQLLAAAFPLDAAMSDRTVDTHIKRIRRKLEGVEPGFDAIEAVYGLGYRMKATRA